MSDNQLSIKTFNFSGVCINISSNKSFEDVTNSIESMIGKANNMLLQKLVNTNASSDDFKTALNSMLGTGSFIRFVDFESGQYLSLCGRTKKAKLYIIGNPLIANQMYELNPAKLHSLDGQDAHPTIKRLKHNCQFKCTTAYCAISFE